MDENKKDYLSEAIDEAKKREAFYQQIVHELRTEERYQNYFKQFSPDSVERFIDHYATHKVYWYQYGASSATWAKRKNEKWNDLARSFIVGIQRIKVFQAIIRWGNYELSIPEARSYYDLSKWLCNPFICPLITPVQPHEIDTALRFLGSPAEERLKYMSISRVTIHSLLLVGDPDREHDEDDYSFFFRYWDKEYGTEYLRAKVPERVQKEYDYVWTYRDHLKGQQPPKEPVAAGQKISLPFWERNTTEKFMAACETAEYKRMYKAHRWWKNRNSFSEVAERELDDLSDTPQNFPIESGDDWREALAGTAEAYARQQVAECIPQVYEEYIDRLEKGDTFTGWVTDMRDQTENSVWYEKHLFELLEGRKLRNEPADFNF